MTIIPGSAQQQTCVSWRASNGNCLSLSERGRMYYFCYVACPLCLYQLRPLCPLQSCAWRRSVDPAAACLHPSLLSLCASLLPCLHSLVFLVSAPLTDYVLLCPLPVLLHLGRTLTNWATIDISSGEWLIRPKLQQPLSRKLGPMQTKTK